MNQPREQIQGLLSEGQTEAAIDALLQWTKTHYTTLHDQIILLRARWGKIQHDSLHDLISPEDAARQTNQVNAALLALLNEAEGREPAAAFPMAARRPRWLLPVLFGAVLLVGLAAFFWIKQSKPGDAIPAEKPSAAVKLPEGNALTIVENGEEVRYEILEATLDKVNGNDQRLTLRLLCSPMLSPRRGMNFWSANFRFEPAGSPAVAPANNLNLIAESHASTEGEVQFVLPAGVRGGKIWMKYSSKEAALEVAW